MKKNSILSIILLFCIQGCSSFQNFEQYTQPEDLKPTINIPTATTLFSDLGTDQFHSYQMKNSVVVEGTSQLWMPVPKTWDDIGQRNVEVIDIEPSPTRVYEDKYGNQIAYWEISDQNSREYSITFSIELEIIGEPEINFKNLKAYDKSSWEYKLFTEPSTNIPTTEINIMQLAQQIVGNEKNAYMQAKLIHKWVSTQLTQGDSSNDVLSIIDSKKFNDCYGPSITFISLLRSIGIPARLVGGYHNYRDHYFSEGLYKWPEVPFGIHVWAEFYIPDYGWYQVEPQNSNVFGIDEERIVLFRGEDIELESGYPVLDHFHMPHINNPPQQYGDNLSLEVISLP